MAGPARADLNAIAARSRQEFGADQAERYRGALAAALARLTDGPFAAGSVSQESVAAGLRSLHVRRLGIRGRHALFYRAEGEGRIVVLRVLHDRMDPGRHLGNG